MYWVGWYDFEIWKSCIGKLLVASACYDKVDKDGGFAALTKLTRLQIVGMHFIRDTSGLMAIMARLRNLRVMKTSISSSKVSLESRICNSVLLHDSVAASKLHAVWKWHVMVQEAYMLMWDKRITVSSIRRKLDVVMQCIEAWPVNRMPQCDSYFLLALACDLRGQ